MRNVARLENFIRWVVENKWNCVNGNTLYSELTVPRQCISK